VDPNYLQSVLTKDITTLECIFDLIDNAIDAARNTMLSRPDAAFDQYGLPSDYSGFSVALRLTPSSFAILDNCAGIEETTLVDKAFVTGTRSAHRFGIGHFGIGLKRALMRLGTRYALSTSTGDYCAKLQFEEADFGLINEELEARTLDTHRSAKTLICVSGLRSGVRQEFAVGSKWRSTIGRDLSRRYGLFVAKGFKISVNGTEIAPFGPGLRTTGPVPVHSRHTSLQEGVDAFVESGMHEKYRLTDESGWKRNSELTDQFGWYFVCNDRIIRVATKEQDLGFTAHWHQEYYGFVGWVRFVAEDAQHLPWDTKKSSIDTSSSAFGEVRDQLQTFADAYRSEQRMARSQISERVDTEKGSGAAAGATSGGDKRGGSSDGERGGRVRGRGRAKPLDPQDHNDNWTTILPASVSVDLDHPKVRALVYEAMTLDVGHCYAGSLLLRAIVEAALLERLKKMGRLAEVRELQFDKQEAAGRKFGDDQKKGFKPTLSNLMEWLNANDDIFPTDVRRECIQARMKFNRHLKELNGVVHENDLTDSSKLKIVRNDVLPLIQFLLSDLHAER